MADDVIIEFRKHQGKTEKKIIDINLREKKLGVESKENISYQLKLLNRLYLASLDIRYDLFFSRLGDSKASLKNTLNCLERLQVEY